MLDHPAIAESLQGLVDVYPDGIPGTEAKRCCYSGAMREEARALSGRCNDNCLGAAEMSSVNEHAEQDQDAAKQSPLWHTDCV